MSAVFGESEEDGGMLRIAICDDRIEDLSRAVCVVEKWLKQDISIEGKIDTYHNVEDLKNVIQERAADYDIYILDIVMKGTNGIEFGRWLQEKCQDALMIYITSSRDYALDAFDNHAVRYLMKPLKEPDFFAAMDTAYTLYRARPRHMITISGKDHISSTAAEDIVYIENKLKNIFYTLKNGQKISSIRRIGTFEDAVGEIAEFPQFIQPHKSFFINMDYITALRGEHILMDDGKEIPVARRRQEDTQKKYIKDYRTARFGTGIRAWIWDEKYQGLCG